MHSIFGGAKSFNQDISIWDVSKVTNMNYMFNGASSFDQNLACWDISKVIGINSINHIFSGATQMINKYPEVTNIYYTNMPEIWSTVFGDCPEPEPEPQPEPEPEPTYIRQINNRTELLEAVLEWNGTENRFGEYHSTKQQAIEKYGHISTWDVSNVTDMNGLFRYATAFNEDISSWDVSNVTDMSSMFFYADTFDKDIGEWDVSNVTNMENMFHGASSFDQNLACWDISKVTGINSVNYIFSDATQMINKYPGVTNIDYTTMPEIWNTVFGDCSKPEPE